MNTDYAVPASTYSKQRALKCELLGQFSYAVNIEDTRKTGKLKTKQDFAFKQIRQQTDSPREDTVQVPSCSHSNLEIVAVMPTIRPSRRYFCEWN